MTKTIIISLLVISSVQRMRCQTTLLQEVLCLTVIQMILPYVDDTTDFYYEMFVKCIRLESERFKFGHFLDS